MVDFKAASYRIEEHQSRCGGTLIVSIDERDDYCVLCWACNQLWHAYTVDPADAIPTDEVVIAAAKRDFGLSQRPATPPCADCGIPNLKLRKRHGQLVCGRCYRRGKANSRMSNLTTATAAR